jgi:hypothetical protein
VAALIDDRILCMHGGLSPELESIDQIKKIEKPTDVPDTGRQDSIQDYCVTCCGQTPIRTRKAGGKTNEESPSPSAQTTSKSSAKNTI